MAQSTPTHVSGFHLVTVAMTGHAEDKGSTTLAHSSLKRCCLNAVNESRGENMGLYRYDQWGCLPDGVVVGYCPSVGYSEISSEAEPTTKDTQNIINTCSRPSREAKPRGADDRKLPRAQPRQAGSRGGRDIKAGYLTRCP